MMGLCARHVRNPFPCQTHRLNGGLRAESAAQPAPITAQVVANPPSPYGISATLGPLTVLGLTNGESYACAIMASNTVGDSAASAPLSAIPSATGAAPSAPEITGITPHASNLLVRWAVPQNDGGSPVAKYTIRWRPLAAENWTTGKKEMA